jgi:hypothetical protein
MQSLHLLETSSAFLTKTTSAPNPNAPGTVIFTSYPCDIDGNSIPAPGLPIYQDALTGTTYVRLTENIPTGPNPDDQARAVAIKALNPRFYSSPSGSVKGGFVAAPDFNGREAEANDAQDSNLLPAPPKNKAA